MAKVVLITGCSTGIGRDLVGRLAQAGYAVVATARKTDTLNDLPAALKLPLDVTQPDSVCQAVEHTLRQLGRIDVLINNAGYALQGALEEIPVEQVQQMFDVNVHGVLRLIRAVVPQMRQQRAGRIINIGSVAGRLALPVNGTYSASKFALEALNDALRLELAPFGIHVVLIEPGPIKTHFDATVQANAQAVLSNPASPYSALYRRSQHVAADMRRGEPGPEAVSRVVQQAIESARPRARYLAGVPFLMRFVFFLGDSVKDLIFKRQYQITAPVK
jgi:NAD(P)-dependent dehydrogenase (short-subunit alcohol dehydrogenase family)